MPTTASTPRMRVREVLSCHVLSSGAMLHYAANQVMTTLTHFSTVLQQLTGRLHSFTAGQYANELSTAIDHLSQPVFLFLDNIWDSSTLKKLLPAGTALPPGSAVLATTRQADAAVTSSLWTMSWKTVITKSTKLTYFQRNKHNSSSTGCYISRQQRPEV